MAAAAICFKSPADQVQFVPKYATKYSAAFDVPSSQNVIIEPGEVITVDTMINNLSKITPNGQINYLCSRSGLAKNNGIYVTSSPDLLLAGSDIVKVSLCNTSDKSFEIQEGEAIAQILSVNSDVFVGLMKNFMKIMTDQYLTIQPHERLFVNTGIKDVVPKQHVGLVYASDLTYSVGLIILNEPGIIDEDYHGDIGIILYNPSNEIITINNGSWIANINFIILPKRIIDEESQERQSGGFGSTG